jgi:PIN domain nuclease of toxin-antitoxin system
VTFVFDANALIAYLNGEQGEELVEGLLTDPQNECFVHATNLCEVFYDFRRTGGEDVAQSALLDLRNAGLMLRDDMDEDLWQEAGRTKADLKRISLADCFCAALAERVDGAVVTADAEFRPLADSGRNIVFIR